MLFSTEPQIITSEEETFDEFVYRTQDEFGHHSVSILVPPGDVRAEADELRAKTRAEVALTDAIASARCSVHLSLGW